MNPVLLVFAMSIGAGLFPASFPAAAETVDASTGPIVYPGAPARPRIRHIRSIRKKSDLTGVKKKGFFAKLFSALSGGDTDLPIFSVPYGIAVLGKKIYVTDTGDGRLTILDLETSEIKHVGEGGDGRLVNPANVAVDADGRMYVTDSGDQSLKAYSPDGKLLWKAKATGGEAAGLNRPAGIALTPEGKLLLVDKGNRRLVLFSKEGKYVGDMARHAKKDFLALPNPVNLWVDENGTIFVNDPLVARVHLFTSTGAAISGFGEQGNNPGYLGRPRGMATDSDGYIHVEDGLFHRVQIFNREGQLLVWYGDPGGGRSGLALPSDIFIDQDDVIYIADTKNRRIQMFQYITYPDEKK